MPIARAAALAAASLACLVAAAPASAQEEGVGPDDVEMARELFRSGLEAASEERWNEARLQFERSYQLVPRASTLLNLAAAQAEVGALVEAARSYRRFVEQAQSGRAAAYREDAEAALSEVEARIARVTLTVEGWRLNDVLEIDGEAQPPGTVESAMEMNPGSHRVVIRRDGEEVGDLDLTLVEGEERGITLAVRDTAPAEALTPEPDGDGEDLAASPWLWVGIGAGVAVIAGVIVGVVVGTSSPELFQGNLGPGMVTFE